MASDALPAVFAVVLYIGVPVVCGFAASRIMKSKGRSELAGWALGLFLVVLGVLIAATRKPLNEPKQSVRCPYCKAIQDVPERVALIDCSKCEQEITLTPPVMGG